MRIIICWKDLFRFQCGIIFGCFFLNSWLTSLKAYFQNIRNMIKGIPEDVCKHLCIFCETLNFFFLSIAYQIFHYELQSVFETREGKNKKCPKHYWTCSYFTVTPAWGLNFYKKCKEQFKNSSPIINNSVQKILKCKQIFTTFVISVGHYPNNNEK